MVALSEIWLSSSVRDEQISVPNFQKPYRTDRQDHNGGVIVYVKNYIPCKRRHDLELAGIECIWLELKLKNKTTLFSIFYRPPDSNQTVLNNIERSKDLAVDKNISIVLITGDFNLNITSKARASQNLTRCLTSTISVKSSLSLHILHRHHPLSLTCSTYLTSSQSY